MPTMARRNVHGSGMVASVLSGADTLMPKLSAQMV